MPTRAEFHKQCMELLQTVELPKHHIIRQHLEAAPVVTFCDCGCHSFDLHLPPEVILPPLMEKSGLFCEFAYSTNHEWELEFLLICDARGYLSSVDVTLEVANVGPIPDDLEIVTLLGVWPAES